MSRERPSSALTDDQIQRLLHHLALAIATPCVTRWERSFGASIVAASRRRGRWQPSAAQAKVMERIVEKFLSRALSVHASNERHYQ